jgi:hypothetical protein
MIRKSLLIVLTLGAVGCPIGCANALMSGRGFGYIGDEGLFYIVSGGIIVGRLRINNGSQEAGFRSYYDDLDDYPLLPCVQADALANVLFVPCWMPSLLLAGYPAITFARWRARRRRRRAGRCAKCGYDLTGNVSGVCPECGNKVKPA